MVGLSVASAAMLGLVVGALLMWTLLEAVISSRSPRPIFTYLAERVYGAAVTDAVKQIIVAHNVAAAAIGNAVERETEDI